MPANNDVGDLEDFTAYSMALTSDRSPVESPSAVAGGTRLPTLRMVKRSPGSVETSKFGTTRLSAQVMNSVSGRLATGEIAEMRGVMRQLLLAELDDSADQLAHRPHKMEKWT